MFLVSVSKAAAVFVISLLEGVASQPCVDLGGPIIIKKNNLVDHLLCQAVPTHWACLSSSTVATCYSIGWCSSLLYL